MWKFIKNTLIFDIFGGNMCKKLLFLLLTITLLFSNSIYAKRSKKKKSKKVTVAVMNFTNNGSRSLKFLVKSLPESISTSLANQRKIRIVERNNLKEILGEIELEQTGLIDTGDVSRAGKIAKADILILGSISGNNNNVTIIIKAVNVESGQVITGKIIRGNAANILDKASALSKVLGSVISGKGIAKLSVSSNTKNSNVYIDGVLLGKAPIVEYKVTAGKHTVKVVADDHIDYDTTVNLNAKQNKNVSAILAEIKVQNRIDIGIGAMAIIPLDETLSTGTYYYLFVGHNYYKMHVSLEIGYCGDLLGGEIGQEQEIVPPDSLSIDQERWFSMISAFVNFSYIPYPNAQYFSPYIGLIGGISRIADWRENATFEGGEELIQKENLYAVGGILGITIIPFAKISLFIEARILTYTKKFTHYTYKSQGIIGEPVQTEDEMAINLAQIGGGIKYYY
jgi:TolB-like protein